MKFSIVVATDINNGIGLYDNNTYSIPWKNKYDMDFFKKLTTNSTIDKKNVVIMGRNTYLSIGRDLPNRINIIITSNHNRFIDKITFSNLNSSLEYCSAHKDKIDKIFVIGGSQLYTEAFKSSYLEYVYWNKINIMTKANIYFNVPLEYNNDFILDKSSLKNKITFMKFKKKNTVSSDELKYLNILKEILLMGNLRQTRNSVTKSIFGKTMEFNLMNEFPIITTKKMFLRGIFEELIWFLRGETDSKLLENKKVNIWKGNTSKEFIESRKLPYKEGDIGNMYGFQLKHAGSDYNGCEFNYSGKGFDQIDYCINLLKTDKYSRRIMMTTFTPDKAHMGVLYPCHGIVIQFYVREHNKINYLSCHMYQRSGDVFLGVPFNITSYSLLTYLICEIINNDINYRGYMFKPDKLIISFGDLHIYENHIDQVKEQITRIPYKFPKINFKKKITSFYDILWEDIELIDYQFHPSIKAEMVA